MREHVADPLDMTVEDAAAGVFEIVNGAMADLLRQMTIERGHDPREFSVLAYGGAGPLHASFYADDLGAESVVVPLGDTASVFSAFGIASSDLNWVEEVANPDVEPFDTDGIVDTFDDLEASIRGSLDEQGVDDAAVSMAREVDLRYQGQVHQVSVDVPTGDLDDADLEDLLERWEAKYEALYGSGSTYADADVELVNQRVLASAATPDPSLAAGGVASGDAQVGTRDVYWPAPSGFVETDIYDGEYVGPGMQITGPAIVQLPDTTVTVRPHQRADVDDYRNIIITEDT
jgi:N-methylhydantoinase A